MILVAGEYAGRPLICNDGIADERGRFLFGTIYYDEKKSYPLGSLYRIEPDGRISVLDEGFHHVNGLGFSPTIKRFILPIRLSERYMLMTMTAIRVR